MNKKTIATFKKKVKREHFLRKWNQPDLFKLLDLFVVPGSLDLDRLQLLFQVLDLFLGPGQLLLSLER